MYSQALLLAGAICLQGLATMVDALPATPATPTTYPTTLTSVWSVTEAQTLASGLDSPFFQLVVETRQTVMLVEPWTAAPVQFPYTLVQTALTTATTDYLVTRFAGGPVTSSRFVHTYHVPSTWVLWPPAPTDLPAAAAVPCGECPSAGGGGAVEEQDPECEALGLDTACQGQCGLRDGLFWCLQRRYTDRADMAMGRACWGNSTSYKQLLSPCRLNDHQVACVPCSGRNTAWEGTSWL